MDDKQLEEVFRKLYEEEGDKAISAFAYSIGKQLETWVKLKTNNLQNENIELKSKLLGYRQKLFEFPSYLNDFDRHFGIVVEKGIVKIK